MSRIPLLLVNALFRYVFRQNTSAPCLTHFTSQVINGEKIEIPEGEEGESVRRSFAQSGNCYLQGKNGIEIEANAVFAPGIKIISANRNRYYDLNPGILLKYNLNVPIKIGFNCMIGANAIILAGVELGNYVTVGAGAVVTKSFPPNVTIVGNPAKVIGYFKNIS